MSELTNKQNHSGDQMSDTLHEYVGMCECIVIPGGNLLDQNDPKNNVHMSFGEENSQFFKTQKMDCVDSTESLFTWSEHSKPVECVTTPPPLQIVDGSKLTGHSSSDEKVEGKWSKPRCTMTLEDNGEQETNFSPSFNNLKNSDTIQKNVVYNENEEYASSLNILELEVASPIRRHVEALSIRAETLRSRNAELERKLESFQKCIELHKKENDSEILELQMNKIYLEEMIVEKDRKLQVLEDTLSRNDSHLKAVECEVDECRNKCMKFDELANRVDELEGQVDSLRRELDEKARVCRGKEEEITNWKGKCLENDKKLKHALSVQKQLEDDIRLVYGQHKQELSEINEKYKHDDYKSRYINSIFKVLKLQDNVEILLNLFADGKESDFIANFYGIFDIEVYMDQVILLVEETVKNSYSWREKVNEVTSQVVYYEKLVEAMKERHERQQEAVRREEWFRLTRIVEDICMVNHLKLGQVLSAMRATNGELQGYRKKNSDMENLVIDLEKNLCNRENLVIDLEKTLCNRENLVKMLSEKVEDLEMEVRNKVEMCAFMEQENDLRVEEMEQNHREEMERMGVECDGRVREMEVGYERRLGEVRDRSERERLEMQERVGMLEGTIERLGYVLGYVKGVMMVYEGELEVMRREREKVKMQLEEYVERVGGLTNELMRRDEVEEGMRVRYEALEMECERLVRDGVDLKELHRMRLDEEAKRLSEVYEQRDRLECEVKEMEVRLEDMRRMMEMMEEEKERMKSKFEAIQCEKERMKSKIEAIQCEMERLQSGGRGDEEHEWSGLKDVECERIFREHDEWLNQTRLTIVRMCEKLQESLNYRRLEYEQENSHLRSVISEDQGKIDDLEMELRDRADELIQVKNNLDLCQLSNIRLLKQLELISELEKGVKLYDRPGLDGGDGNLIHCEFEMVQNQNASLSLQLKQVEERNAELLQGMDKLRVHLLELDENYKHQLRAMMNSQKRLEEKFHQCEQERIWLLFFIASLREKLVVHCEQPIIREILCTFQPNVLKSAQHAILADGHTDNCQ